MVLEDWGLTACLYVNTVIFVLGNLKIVRNNEGDFMRGLR